MGEEISNTLSLDLNLGPDPEISLESVMNTPTVDLTVLTNGPSNRESEYPRMFRTQARRHRSRFRHVNILPVLNEIHSPSRELGQLLISSANGATLPAGEGSLSSRERVNEDSKKCKNGNKVMGDDNAAEEKKVIEKSIGGDGSFFDCCICLDLCKEPVVTNCGHLHCWSCIYNWLEVSEVKYCPVCKGEISVETLTPIYGHGQNKRESEEDLDTNIPLRPQARRIDSLRIALERSDYIDFQGSLVRDSSTGERRVGPFFNQFMNSRGVRVEQNQTSEPLVAPLDDVSDIDLNLDINEGESGNLRNQEEDSILLPSVGVEDRDSFSSIVGVINSESQVDTSAEIDSYVRRPDENGSRVSQVYSADSLRQWRTRRRLA